jgi:polar amino acid transport system substrate-binding protein
MAARLGIPRVEWRLTEFGGLIEGLEAGRFDVIAAGMFITPGRQQRVAFSLPAFRVGPGLLVRKGNPLGLRSYADLLQNPQARVAVVSGSAEESQLLRLGCPGERLVRVPHALSGRAAVESGLADALALSAPTVRWMAADPRPGLAGTVEACTAAEDGAAAQRALGGFAFRKGDRALRLAWDAELAAFVGSPEHRRLVSAFGFTDAELPPGAAAPSGRTSKP